MIHNLNTPKIRGIFLQKHLTNKQMLDKVKQKKNEERMNMNNKITTIMNVNDNEVRVMRIEDEDYISLTDLARYKNPDDPSDVIKKWLSNYDTIEFLGLWEELSNEDFNSAEFSLIKNEAPKKSFTMSPSQWCTRVNAKGLTFSKGKYSIGTFAHSDIALEFAS